MRRSWNLGSAAVQWASSLLAAGVGLPCLAQQAMVVVSHNDPDGIVEPGQTVQISATVSWNFGAWYLQEIKGSVLASPDVGVAANNVFPYPHNPSNPVTIVDPGVPGGGSVLGMHIFTGAQMWVALGSIVHPWYLNTGIEVLRFDWTAPTTPGVVEFDFIPDPSLSAPNFLGPSFLAFPLPTTFVGTSLTVIPAPGAGVVLAAGLAGACIRRRRGVR